MKVYDQDGQEHEAPCFIWFAYDTFELHWFSGERCVQCSQSYQWMECDELNCHDGIMEYDVTSVYRNFINNMKMVITLAAAAQMAREESKK